MTKGPSHSRVDSGQSLSDYNSKMRQTLSLASHLSSSGLEGYALLFDERIKKEESSRWFNEVLPAMDCLLLRFPALLELHYLNSGNLINRTETGLRVLGPNKAGIVFLSQELIATLLSCVLSSVCSLKMIEALVIFQSSTSTNIILPRKRLPKF